MFGRSVFFEGGVMKGGPQRKRRHLNGVETTRMNVQIRDENYARIQAIADARGVSMGMCVDEMVDADWRRREAMFSRGTKQVQLEK